MDINELLDSISKKLSALIALGLGDDKTTKEKVEMLMRFNLSSREISEILNTSTGTVDVLRSRAKRSTNQRNA